MATPQEDDTINFSAMGREEDDTINFSAMDREEDDSINFSTMVGEEDDTISYTDLTEEQTTEKVINSLPAAETINDLMTDSNFAVVGQYMDQRFGMREAQHDRQKIVDSYVNHMRKFNFGQSVVTATELAYLSTDDEAKKLGAGQAYKLFDNMKGAFSEDYTFAQKADAVYDYGRALIVDPINLVSLGFGKLITGGATKVAAQLAKETVKKLVKEEAKKKGIKGALTKSMQVEANIIEQRVIGKIIRGETVEGVAEGAFQEGLKREARKEVLSVSAFDTAASVTVDGIYQKALMQSGVQDDYSVMQGGLAGLGGIFGGSLAYGLTLLNKAPSSEATLPLFMQAFDNAAATEASVKKLAMTKRGDNNKEVLAKMDFAALTKALKNNSTAAARWSAKVTKGNELRRTRVEDIADPLRDELLGAFLHGVDEGPDSFKGLKTIFEDFGIELANEDDTFANFTDFLTETIKALPKGKGGAYEEVNNLYQVTLKQLPDFNAQTLGEGLNTLASLSSEWGRTGNTLSKLKKDLGLAKGKTPVQKYNTVIDETLDVPTKNVRDKIADGSSKLQQNLIRMLITHPGTTALNLVGWANATGMQSIGDTLRGALYGGRALGELAIGRTTKATDFATKSKLMFTLQRQKATNLVSPYATQQATYSFLAANPKSQKELFRYMSGGIELDDVYKNLGVKIDEMEKPGAWESVMDFAQTMYGVKAQDMYTKSQEFMYALDKQIRLKYGKTYAEFLQDPALYRTMKGDDFVEVQAIAVENALRNVYAKSYAKPLYGDTKGTLNSMAGVLEDMRKYPIIGAMVPFGQFFNNTLGHMFDHTGISLIHKYAANTTRDPMELLTKSAVGMSLIGITTAREYSNMEEGLALFDERGSDGAIRNRMYDFPYSFYKAMGRMGAHAYRDGKVPTEMVNEVVTLFGPKNLTRQLGDSAKMSFDLLVDIAQNEDVVVVDGLVKVVQDAGSMYISAYSRPLDPINQMVALSKGENYIAPDRKQGSEWLNKSLRYSDQIFGALMEEPVEKQTALTDTPAMMPIGRIFGYREVAGQTSIQRMFNEIGRPQWRTDIKSFIPEVQNNINGHIFKFLELNASQVIDKDVWVNGTEKTRKKILSDVLARSKSDVVDVLEGSIDRNDERTLSLYKLSNKNSGISKEDVEKALISLDIDKDVTDLDKNQLSFLVYYLELSKEEEESKVLLSQPRLQ